MLSATKQIIYYFLYDLTSSHGYNVERVQICTAEKAGGVLNVHHIEKLMLVPK